MISKKMTVRELKKYIKEETSRINSAIKEYNNSKDKNKKKQIGGSLK